MNADDGDYSELQTSGTGSYLDLYTELENVTETPSASACQRYGVVEFNVPLDTL